MAAVTESQRFRAPIYWAYCVVIFAIARLSCLFSDWLLEVAEVIASTKTVHVFRFCLGFFTWLAEIGWLVRLSARLLKSSWLNFHEMLGLVAVAQGTVVYRSGLIGVLLELESEYLSMIFSWYLGLLLCNCMTTSTMQVFVSLSQSNWIVYTGIVAYKRILLIPGGFCWKYVYQRETHEND